jgi:aspartate carbamoyltransferase regulatory subunit
MLYKVIRRWYTVQQVEAGSEDEAVEKARDETQLGEDFYEEDQELAPVCPYCKTELQEAEGDEGKYLYCPNEMCLYDEEIPVKEVTNANS